MCVSWLIPEKCLYRLIDMSFMTNFRKMLIQTYLHVFHDLFTRATRATRLIHMCHMTRSLCTNVLIFFFTYFFFQTYLYVFHDLFTRATWLVHMCHLTLSFCTNALICFVLEKGYSGCSSFSGNEPFFCCALPQKYRSLFRIAPVTMRAKVDQLVLRYIGLFCGLLQ